MTWNFNRGLEVVKVHVHASAILQVAATQKKTQRNMWPSPLTHNLEIQSAVSRLSQISLS